MLYLTKDNELMLDLKGTAPLVVENPGLWYLLGRSDASDIDTMRRDIDLFSEWWWSEEARPKLYANELQRRTCGNSFSVTQAGFSGQGPRHIQEGDILAVFNGDNHLVILRPQNGFVTIVGAAYVLGISEGLDVLEPLLAKSALEEEPFKVG